MDRQLHSTTAIGKMVLGAEAEITPEITEAIRQAAVSLDEPYSLSLDGVWYFANPAVARIRAALA